MDECCIYKLNYRCNENYKLYIISLFVIIWIDKQKMTTNLYICSIYLNKSLKIKK
jgi:hypothetical protein